MVTSRDSSALQDLLEEYFHEVQLIGKIGRSLFEKIRKQLVFDYRLFKVCRIFKPEIGLGTSIPLSHVSAINKIQSIIMNEDDAREVPFFSKGAYTFADCIITPDALKGDNFGKKHIKYPGYHELAYLHPQRFNPDPERLRPQIEPGEPFFLLRFSALAAHHDVGKTGITRDLAREIIRRLESHGRVFISSERDLEDEFTHYSFPFHPREMHHALAYAQMVVADSQTMTAEAAVLGTPALRFNDFVGRLSYLEELEHCYGLIRGIPTSEPSRLLDTISEWLGKKDQKKEWQMKQEKMLKEKIDVTAFFVWFIENYPNSLDQLNSGNFQWEAFY